MQQNPIGFFFQTELLRRDIAVYIAGLNANGQATHVARLLELTPLDEATEVAGPTLRISYDDAQRMMDRLWDIGIRPTEGQGSAGMLAATERHLTDMRAIAFDALGIGNRKG
jgi:hypothetical protein